MSSTQKKILFIDLACILISGFIFLFISPSIEGRQRIIYIVPQVLICAALVIGSRFLIGIYREYFMDVAGSEVSPYVYVSQYAENDPAVTWTKASALFMPALYNPNGLYVASVQETPAANG